MLKKEQRGRHESLVTESSCGGHCVKKARKFRTHETHTHTPRLTVMSAGLCAVCVFTIHDS